MKSWGKIVMVGGISFLLLFIGLIQFANSYYPHWRKMWSGTGRKLSPSLKAIVKVDGVEIPQAKSFAMNELFNGTPTNSLILLLPSHSDSLLHNIFIVSRKYKNVGIPVGSGRKDYDLLDEQTLFQSETGSMMVAFDGPKYDGYNPQLEIKEKYLKFVPPESEKLGGRKIEVFLP